MKEIILRRGQGKTRKLIELANNKNGLIVCFNENEVRRIYLEAQERGFNINKPISFYKFLSREGIVRDTDILIDEMDMLKYRWIDMYGGLKKNKDITPFEGIKRIARRKRLKIIAYTNGTRA
jgi:hypothetical protein